MALRRLYKIVSILGLLSMIVFSTGLIPAVADQLNRTAVRWIAENNAHAARLAFSYLYLLGNGVAANNLGVLYLRGLGVKRNRERAIALFEGAVTKDIVAARYNLTLTMPNRFKTPKDLIRRQLALLDENIALGDIPSHVLAAQRLYYVNREEFVPDRQARKLALLATAAQTGDPDYLYQYGKELEVQAFEQDDVPTMILALRAYRDAFDRGDLRGAEALGAARSIQWDTTPSREEILERPASEWTLIAAKGGRITAKCRHAQGRFRRLDQLAEFLSEPSILNDRVDQHLDRENTVSWTTSLAYLQECARAKKITFPPNPPFGDVALYARKRRGSVTALANSPEWANYYLGQLHALGLHVERDIEKARAHFDRAAKGKTFAQSDSWIAYLDGQRPQ